VTMLDNITQWFQSWAREHPVTEAASYTFEQAEQIKNESLKRDYHAYLQFCQETIQHAHEAHQIMQTGFWKAQVAWMDRQKAWIAEQLLDSSKNYEEVLVARGKVQGLMLFRRQLESLKKAGEQAEQALVEMTKTSAVPNNPGG